MSMAILCLSGTKMSRRQYRIAAVPFEGLRNGIPLSWYSLRADKSAFYLLTFLILNKNICCGYSKEPSN